MYPGLSYSWHSKSIFGACFIFLLCAQISRECITGLWISPPSLHCRCLEQIQQRLMFSSGSISYHFTSTPQEMVPEKKLATLLEKLSLETMPVNDLMESVLMESALMESVTDTASHLSIMTNAYLAAGFVKRGD